MFWNWFWDLYEISFGLIQPCSKCGLKPSQDCGYLRETYCSEHECVAPDQDLECDGCKYLLCKKCRKESLDGNC